MRALVRGRGKVALDRFPSAFKRFEERVDISDVREFEDLERIFGRWAGYRWIPTADQERALRIEAERIGIPLRRPTPEQRRAERIIQRNILPFAVRREKDRSGRVHFRDTRTGRFTRKIQSSKARRVRQ
jgi:hypothetical protein